MTRFQYEVQERKITVAKMAELLDVSGATAHSYINGTTRVPVDKALKASEFFGVPVDVLFAEFDPQPAKAA